MRFRNVVFVILCLSLVGAASPVAAVPARQAGGAGAQSGATPMQRLDVMRSRLETMRRTLNSAIAGLNSKDTGAKEEAADDPRKRLRGLEKDVGSLLSEVNDVRGKQERAERYDQEVLDKLEAAVADLDNRVQAGMRATAAERRAAPAAAVADSKDGDKKSKKKGGNFFSRLLGRGGGSDEYDELIGTVAPGRDRTLFVEAAKEARKENYETARALFGVIINTYPDSPFLPLAKLAIADTFYLEGTTGALIQAAQAYQDWFTFFPTHPLADDVMLKMAEVEMRRMGLPDREIKPAQKAEQRLKVFIQQFPNSDLRPEVEIRLREVQENLAQHGLQVGNFYYDRYFQGKASSPKGAQSRYREIVEKYPNFSEMATVLYRLGVTYKEEEEPDEAAKYFQQLVRFHPNSDYAEKAKEELAAIGTPAPDPDQDALKREPPQKPGMMTNIKNQIFGTVPMTVDKAGVLISNKDKAADLIQQAIEHNGELPATPATIKVNRTAPARQLPKQQTPPPAAKTGAGEGLSAQPTQPGPPKSGSDPARPPATQPVAPATPPPPVGVKP